MWLQAWYLLQHKSCVLKVFFFPTRVHANAPSCDKVNVLAPTTLRLSAAYANVLAADMSLHLAESLLKSRFV